MLDLLLPNGLSPWTAALLIAISFFTSALTAAFGIGGGVAMLGALAGTVPPSVIIAVHAFVQVGSNLSRAILQRAHILWRPTMIFAFGSVFGALAGAYLFVSLPERWLLGLIGLTILILTWVPKPRIPGLETTGMAIGGFIATFITMFIGSTGPFVQALFLPMKLEKRVLIASHAACMVVHHGLKIIAFGILGIAFKDYLALIAFMIAAGFLGTWFGTRMLEHIPQKAFDVVLKGVLTVLALDLIRRAIWR